MSLRVTGWNDPWWHRCLTIGRLAINVHARWHPTSHISLGARLSGSFWPMLRVRDGWFVMLEVGLIVCSVSCELMV